MSIGILRSMMLLCGVLGLISCGGGSGSGADKDVLITVHGQVINGPLAGASVSITDAAGSSFGPVISDAQGSFSIQVSNPVSPLLLVSDGGTLDGVAYSGQLRAYCAVSANSDALSCHVTPYSSLIARLAETDPELSEQQAAQQVFDLFRLSSDPFVADNTTPGSIPLYLFDLAAARSAINGGAGLSDWLDAMADWVSAPFVGTAPAGTPVYRVSLRQRTANGTAGPDYVDVPMGGQAQFNMVPDANYVVENATGCGGSLDGTVYTTAPVISASTTTGVCQVEVRFGLQKFSVNYIAGEGGSIVGQASQSVSYGFDSSEVIATPDTGFEFVAWSDGWTDSDPANVPPVKRSDSNITDDFSVAASFQRKQLMLSYEASVGGSISGETEQILLYGDDASEVIAQPNNGYDFVGWSDGLATPERTDKIVTTSTTLTARFAPRPEAVPWSQGLHGGDIRVQITGPTRVEITWPTEPGMTYDLYITTDPATVLDEYALFDATLMPGAVPPLTVDSLAAEQPVYLALQANGELAGWSSFVPRSWGFDGRVFSQDSDLLGNRFFGGDFSGAIQNVGGGASLPLAGLLALADHGLPFPDVNGVVYAITDDGAGGWYIGGQFSAVDGLPRQNLARLDAAGRLLEWDVSVSGSGAVVKSLALSQTGLLLVGGRFDFAAGTGQASPSVRANLALFDGSGSLRSSFNPVVNGEVRDIILVTDVAIIGGDFSEIGGQPAGGIGYLELNGVGIASGISVNGAVNVLKLENNRLIAGGDFTEVTVNGQTRPQSLLAIFDFNGELPARAWQFTGPPGQSVNTLEIDGGKLLVGGSFVAVDGSPRAGVALFDQSAGDLLHSEIGVDGAVNSLLVADGVFYAAGDFAVASGVNGSASRHSLAAFDGAGNLLDWNPRLSGEVKTLASFHDVLTVGGQIRGISARPRERLAAIDADGNLLPWAPAADNDVLSLAIHGDTVYLAGRFSQLGDQLADTGRAYLGAVDRIDGTLLPWNPGADGQVSTLLNVATVVYAGGTFTEVGGLARQNLAAIDLAGDPLSWNPGTNGSVDVLLAEGGLIYAGGQFTAAGGGIGNTARPYLAAFDSEGDLQSWNPAVDGRVRSITALDGVLYVGGDFANAGVAVVDAERQHLAAFDSLGDLLSWDPGANGSVTGLSAANGVIYAVGNFTEVAGQPQVGLVALDSFADLLDWNPADIVQPYSVRVADGLISVVGDFTRLSGAVDAPRSGAALFDPAGELLAR